MLCIFPSPRVRITAYDCGYQRTESDAGGRSHDNDRRIDRELRFGVAGSRESRMIVARSGVSPSREACQPAKYYGNLFPRDSTA